MPAALTIRDENGMSPGGGTAGPVAGNAVMRPIPAPHVGIGPVADAQLAERERELEQWERDIKADAAKQLERIRAADARDEEVKRAEAHLQQGKHEFADRMRGLGERDEQVKRAEAERDEGYAVQRAQQQDALALRHQQLLAEVERHVEVARSERFAAIEQEMAQQRDEQGARMQAERDLLAQRQEALDADRSALEQQRQTLRRERITLNAELESLAASQAELSDRIERLARDRIDSAQAEATSARDENRRLLSLIDGYRKETSRYDTLTRQLGGQDPGILSQQLVELRQRNEELVNQLQLRPSEQVQKDFERSRRHEAALAEQNARLEEENAALRPVQLQVAQLDHRAGNMELKNRQLHDTMDVLEAENRKLGEMLRRASAGFAPPEEREARIADIRRPLPQFKDVLPRRQDEMIDEQSWLEDISRRCAEHGLVFDRRILNAFHTSLKTAEFSPLTVLAGASGTGKSELPRLYAHFGGINFLNVPVQPNWDSQESLLGYFNSIDNRFDAQPLLRLLAQAQENPADDYPGLSDTMSLVLLDEMNLAHVEMYFAEFLSRLENRRSMQRDRILPLEVKLGAGIDPYQLQLGRNVLWTGTMNQDETTKALSDKVIDRGFILHFPRPAEFRRRAELKALAKQGAPLLRTATWQKWVKLKSSFDDGQVQPFKETAQRINDALGEVGRALGHRVWQSIEYYMANHPAVLVAQQTNDEHALKREMHLAFEDQLVLKVMPKLRGIETRGSKCLERIRIEIIQGGYGILDDFDRATRIGYGQFMWSSADYLNAGEPK